MVAMELVMAEGKRTQGEPCPSGRRKCQGLPGGEAKAGASEDGDGFHALQQIEQHAAAGKRDCQGENLPQSLFVCAQSDISGGCHVLLFAQLSQAVQGGSGTENASDDALHLTFYYPVNVGGSAAA